MPKLSIIIPAHNEADNLEVLLPKIKAAAQSLDYEVVLINNASTDTTQRVMDRFAADPHFVVVSEPQLGFGYAILAGLRKARGDFFAMMPSDNQVDPRDAIMLYQRCVSEHREVYKAIRKTRVNDGLKRIIISRVYNFLFKLFFGLTTKDINACPKIFSRRFYEQAKLESTDWFIDAEIVIKATRLGYPIGEAEIDYLPRLKGKSTVRLVHIFQFLKNMVRWYQRLKHE